VTRPVQATKETGIIAAHNAFPDGLRFPADMSAAGHNCLRAAQVQAGLAPGGASSWDLTWENISLTDVPGWVTICLRQLAQRQSIRI
jgi:hypothetical protein